jgi:hypothetical protein
MPEHHRIHHLALRLEEIVSPFRLRAIELEIDMDFTAFDAALAEIKTEVGNIETNQAAAVAKATTDANAANQAELDAKVAADLTPAAVGFPEAPTAEVAPEPTAEVDPNAPPVDPNAPSA